MKSGYLNNTNAQTHGMVNTPTYYSWKSMKARCLCPTAQGYNRYGGMGITIYEPWLEFKNFFDDMGKRPKGKTLDRIDPYGNYEPSNCRWATPSEQQFNRRTLTPPYSGHHGVYMDWSSPNVPYRVQILIDGKMKTLGKFKTKQKAIEVAQEALNNR